MKLILVQPQLSAGPEADNLGAIRAVLDAARVDFAPDDILLLPETFDRRPGHERYERDVATLARACGCHVVGGSHRAERGGFTVNAGVACDPAGNCVGRYEKLRPYAGERETVQGGSALGELVIAGRNVLVLVCADFWFADVFQRAARLPDLVLVPALSVTRKTTPEYSRTLWRHLAVARAYEFGVYVGISDWGHPSELPILSTSGVAGFADPTRPEPERLFTPLGERSVAVHALDFAALEAFRRDRTERGFFWKPPT